MDSVLPLPAGGVDLADSYLQSGAYSSTRKSLQHVSTELELSSANHFNFGEFVCSNPYKTSVFWQV